MNRHIRQPAFLKPLCSALLFCVMALPAAGQVHRRNIFVRINGDKIITEHDVDIRMNSLLQRIVFVERRKGSSEETILRSLEKARQDRWQIVIMIVQDTLIQAEADRMGLKMNSAAVTEILEDRISRMGGSSHIRTEQLREQIIRQQKQLFVMEDWKRSIPRASPAQIEAYYRSNKKKYAQQEGYKVRYIKFRKQGTDIEGRVMTPELARRRADRVRAEAARPGADFEALVRKNSDDKHTRLKGGLLADGDGYVALVHLAPDFRQALSNMVPGSVSAVLDLGASGFVLLKLEDHRSGDTLALSKVQERIQKELRAAAAKRTQGKRLRQLFEKAHICDGKGDPIAIDQFLIDSKDGSANRGKTRSSPQVPPARSRL